MLYVKKWSPNRNPFKHGAEKINKREVPLELWGWKDTLTPVQEQPSSQHGDGTPSSFLWRILQQLLSPTPMPAMPDRWKHRPGSPQGPQRGCQQTVVEPDLEPKLEPKWLWMVMVLLFCNVELLNCLLVEHWTMNFGAVELQKPTFELVEIWTLDFWAAELLNFHITCKSFMLVKLSYT